MGGKVYLVGAGPGHPGLITVRGRELLRRAEVLVYDSPCAEELLRQAPGDAERVAVGRWPDLASRLSQRDINALLVERGLRGRTVVRLKSGDPYVFGRGGEEACALAEAGVPFEVVPGVTSALAAAAYAGIDITSRDVASEVLLAIAQTGETPDAWGLDLDELARTRATVVLYLDPAIVGRLAAELVRRGRSESTPVAVVESAGGGRQRTFEGTLADIGACRAAAPAVALVGEAVRARPRLAWAERRPLAGKAVVLTRPLEQALATAQLLDEQGAEVLYAPCIAIEPPASWEALDRAIGELERFDWVAFTSANGVERFLERLRERGRDVRALGGARIAAVGPSTARALGQAWLRADRVPSDHHGEALARSFAAAEVAERRVLVVRAEEGSPSLVQGLRALGAQVDVAPAYRTVASPIDGTRWRALLESGGADAVVFASPSAVASFVAAVAPADAPRLMARTCVAALGPSTAGACRERGFVADLVPAEATAAALVEALVGRLRLQTAGCRL